MIIIINFFATYNDAKFKAWKTKKKKKERKQHN